ncbi:MAG: radical SAM protein, partial [Candidatus Lokiarchaeota archaeon]
IGIGLTNNCNLNCAHCYRNKNEISNITLKQIQILCNALPIQSIGFGTGENILNPEFLQIITFLSERDIKLSLASNGLTITTLDDNYLQLFNDLEISIDFPDKKKHDNFRGTGNWDLAHQAIEKTKDLGISTTILTTLMSVNYQEMDRMVDLAKKHELNLRVSVCQSVNSNKFHLNYDQFWEGFRLLFKKGELISCSEPVVRAVLGFDNVYSPCGHKSIRINPKGEVIPCVYWEGINSIAEPIPNIEDLKDLGDNILNSYYFNLARQIPPKAVDCECQGGCASRRALSGTLNSHDEYCPWHRGDELKLSWQKADSKDLVRINNNCTTIVN